LLDGSTGTLREARDDDSGAEQIAPTAVADIFRDGRADVQQDEHVACVPVSALGGPLALLRLDWGEAEVALTPAVDELQDAAFANALLRAREHDARCTISNAALEPGLLRERAAEFFERFLGRLEGKSKPAFASFQLVDRRRGVVAQDFGAVELTVLLAAVRSRTGVTIAGDLNQKIVPEAEFIGWDALARELGIGGAKVSKLEVAHRSTVAIMRVADSIVGDETSKGRPGPIPTLTVTDSQEGQLDVAADLAKAVLKELPQAHVCVVTRHAAAAKTLHGELSSRLAELGTPVRIGHNKEFEFAPGVTVTNMRQIKGLEFDAVIAVDATTTNYPDTEQGRRNLYTLLTRAKDRLDIVSPGEPTALLKTAVDGGLVEVAERMTVEPVVFMEEDEEPI
jgi:hypothetical protein